MEKTLFKEFSHRERVEMFESNADAIEQRTYFEELSEEELTERRSRFAQKSIEVAKIEDRKKEAVAEFKHELTPLQTEQQVLLNEIKTGHTEKHGRIFKMIDHENGTVGFYSENGNLVESRPATRDERCQLTITSATRKRVVNE